ncbi:hypothetical protein STENM36S_08777 [Streptomyces tendae]
MLAAARPGDGGAPDPVAARVLAETAEYLGAGLADLVNLFQPERILVGGSAGLQLGLGVPGVGTGPHAGPTPCGTPPDGWASRSAGSAPTR